MQEIVNAAWVGKLPGRSWAELQPHFERLFTALLRVLDDVKETVRKAALAGWR